MLKTRMVAGTKMNTIPRLIQRFCLMMVLVLRLSPIAKGSTESLSAIKATSAVSSLTHQFFYTLLTKSFDIHGILWNKMLLASLPLGFAVYIWAMGLFFIFAHHNVGAAYGTLIRHSKFFLRSIPAIFEGFTLAEWRRPLFPQWLCPNPNIFLLNLMMVMQR